MKSFIKVMRALSDPNRVKIAKLLQHRVMCVCELQGALGISQPAVSNHLKILEEAGIVEHRKEGRWVNYYLRESSDSPCASSLLGNFRHWLDDETHIENPVQKLSQFNRYEICGKS